MPDVTNLRRFNRSFTQRVGLLEESYLDSGRPLGPSRLLFEIGTSHVRLLDLRRRLGLDSGYISRLLGQLEGDGLVAVERDPSDGRQRIIHLTRAGRAEWRRLDKRSDDVAQRIMEPLSDRQRAELDAALATADRLLRASTISFDIVGPRSPEARSTLTRYFAELDARFSDGFDATSADENDAVMLTAPRGALVIVRNDVEAIGCGGVQTVDGSTAEIKRMWIDPAWRGLGLGPRLLVHLEHVAKSLNKSRVVLDTNASLVEAVAMYARTGYRPIPRYNDNPYAHHWFAKDL